MDYVRRYAPADHEERVNARRPLAPRMGMKIAHAHERDYLILTWKPGEQIAVSIESRCLIDDARRARIESAVVTLLDELGYETEVQT